MWRIPIPGHGDTRIAHFYKSEARPEQAVVSICSMMVISRPTYAVPAPEDTRRCKRCAAKEKAYEV